MDEKKTVIGTLAEKNIHATLKRWIEPDVTKHEVRFHRFVADVCTEERIYEIQTRQFFRLKRKLSVFLAEKKVTVVYPVPHLKTISWIDPETGETTPKRRSPKVGSAFDLFMELTGILEFLNDPNLTVRVYLLDVDEYKYLDGWSRDRKRGSHRAERIPTALVSTVDLSGPADYASLLPQTLPAHFTVKDLSKAAKISPTCASRAVACLRRIGAITYIGKQGHAFLYEKTPL